MSDEGDFIDPATMDWSKVPNGVVMHAAEDNIPEAVEEWNRRQETPMSVLDEISDTTTPGQS